MRIALASYFLIPLLVYLTIGVGRSGFSFTVESLTSLPPNYVFFALPQLVWLGLTYFLKLRPTITHAGYLGATAALVALHISFECCFNNGNGIGWFYYYPAAGIVMAALCFIVFLGSRAKRSTA